MTQKISRKEFLKVAGLAAAAIPAVQVVGRIGNDEILESKDQFGGFLVRRKAGGADNFPHRIDMNKFERYKSYNNMFGRNRWDEEFKAKKAALPQDVKDQKIAANDPGWTPFDVALRTSASWLRGNKGANAYGWVTEASDKEKKLTGYTLNEITKKLKVAALFNGACAVGIAEMDEKWVYADVGSTQEASRLQDITNTKVPVKGDEGPIEIPKSMNRVIVMLIEQDYECYTVNGISMLNSAAASQGYSMMKYAAASVAAYVRDLGYQAIPCGNDTAQSIPQAIAAGLGEHGRHGLLISPKFGSRVRICKVLTDMPLNIDSPISFGAKEFCEKCELCATYCPSGCIPKGDSYSFDTFDINNQPGVEKWQVDQEKCYLYWTQAGVGCANCQSACPFTKPQGWVHEATKILIGAKVGSLDSMLANLDEISGYGAYEEDVDPDDSEDFWNRTGGYVQNTDFS